MIKLALSSVLCATLLLPCAALAVEQDGSAKSKPNPNKVVCRSEDSTGSRLSQVKRCMTLAQWAQEKQSSRQEIERIQNGRYKNN